jgi:phasin family protein
MNTNTRITDPVAASNNATQRAYGEAASAWRDGMSQAAGGFGKTEAKFKDGIENARRATEDWVQFCQGNIEALVRSGQIWASGVQDLSKQATASAQGSLEEAVSSAQKLSSVRSLKDVLEIQTTLARSLVERSVSEAGRFAEASVKLAEQAIAPITARLTLAAEKFAKSA